MPPSMVGLSTSSEQPDGSVQSASQTSGDKCSSGVDCAPGCSNSTGFSALVSGPTCADDGHGLCKDCYPPPHDTRVLLDPSWCSEGLHNDIMAHSLVSTVVSDSSCSVKCVSPDTLDSAPCYLPDGRLTSHRELAGSEDIRLGGHSVPSGTKLTGLSQSDGLEHLKSLVVHGLQQQLVLHREKGVPFRALYGQFRFDIDGGTFKSVLRSLLRDGLVYNTVDASHFAVT